MKTLTQMLLVCLVSALGFTACKRTEKYDLSKEQILGDLGTKPGVIVDVVGDDGPYRSDGDVWCNYGEDNNGTDWTSRGGYKLEYRHEKDFYHVIHVYVNKAGGALLVGRRIPAPSKQKSEQDIPPNDR